MLKSSWGNLDRIALFRGAKPAQPSTGSARVIRRDGSTVSRRDNVVASAEAIPSLSTEQYLARQEARKALIALRLALAERHLERVKRLARRLLDLAPECPLDTRDEIVDALEGAV